MDKKWRYTKLGSINVKKVTNREITKGKKKVLLK